MKSQYVYTASAAARILGVATKMISAVQEWATVIWVHVKGQRPRFVSKAAFTTSLGLTPEQVTRGTEALNRLSDWTRNANQFAAPQQRPEVIRSGRFKGVAIS